MGFRRDLPRSLGNPGTSPHPLGSVVRPEWGYRADRRVRVVPGTRRDGVRVDLNTEGTCVVVSLAHVLGVWPGVQESQGEREGVQHPRLSKSDVEGLGPSSGYKPQTDHIQCL